MMQRKGRLHNPEPHTTTGTIKTGMRHTTQEVSNRSSNYKVVCRTNSWTEHGRLLKTQAKLSIQLAAI